MPKAPMHSETVQEILGATLQAADDPGLTVHRLPEASKADLENLGRTLQETDASTSGRHISTQTMVRETTPQKTVFDHSDLQIAHAQETLERHSGARAVLPEPGSATEGVSGHDFFALSKQLGKGGMGVVYGARQISLDRDVAVKTMREGAASPQQRAAFLREALTTGVLSHPNIVPVHLFGRDAEGRLFLVMKQVSGKPWNKILKEAAEPRQGFDLGKHLDIFQKVCDAVAFAHARSIVHRDLKPENVMIGDYGEVTVMDWGLALDVSGTGSIAASKEKATTVAGTPAYMAPEMALAQLDKIGPATDIYLLGAILYELVTGKPPHTGRTVFEVLEHAAFGKVESIVPRERLPREVRDLERIIRKAMAQEPAQRYGAVSELQAEVKSFQAGQGDRTESDALTKTAREEFAALAKDVDGMRVTSPFYARCGEVLAKTQQALALWGFNPRAVRLRQEALALYADLAVTGRDWGLAESHIRDLRLSGAGGAALAQPVDARLRQSRDTWNRRQALIVRASRVAAVFFFITLGLSMYLYFKWSETKILLEQSEQDVADLQAKVPPEPKKTDPHAVKTGSRPPELDPNPLAVHPLPTVPKPDPVKPPPPVVPPRDAAWWIRTGEGSAVPPDPKSVAHLQDVLGLDRKLLLWDDAGGAWTWNMGTPPPEAGAALFPPGKIGRVARAAWVDDRTLALADEKGVVYVGDSPDRPWNTIMRCGEEVQALAARREGGEVVIAAATKGTLLLSKGLNAEPVKAPLIEPVLALHFYSDRSLAMVTTLTLELREPKRQPMRLRLGNKEIARAVVAANAKRFALVVAETPKYMQMVGMENPNALSVGFQNGNVACLAISDDGELTMAGSDRGELMLCAGGKGRLLQAGPAPAFKAIAIEPGGAKAYTLDERFSVREWDLTKP
ncbi:MAG: serine/threonine protein kinase [Planctomycetes bacterium]|nr:serine/threonine protein kinase [Planctomycetota bacterium]